jgi:hypothetical protein
VIERVLKYFKERRQLRVEKKARELVLRSTYTPEWISMLKEQTCFDHVSQHKPLSELKEGTVRVFMVRGDGSIGPEIDRIQPEEKYDSIRSVCQR